MQIETDNTVYDTYWVFARLTFSCLISIFSIKSCARRLEKGQVYLGAEGN